MIKNYLGQLRFYSYADLVLLLISLNCAPRQILAASLLWFGFLIHLEWRHRDVGRYRWPPLAWITSWIVAIITDPSMWSIVFIALAVSYSLKKRFPAIARVSFLYNGALKTALLLAVSTPNPRQLLIVFIAMSMRNLAGDFRDIVKDSSEGVLTLPVAVGLRKDIDWLYPTVLAATSLMWTRLGNLPVTYLIAAWAVQALTYRMTPR